MIKVNRTLNQIQDKVFHNIHNNNLIYNTCWEDPRCDRQMLDIDPESQMVMITSAGCNALDYLLDNPKAVHTIDMNPRQNALLDMKKVLLRDADYESLWSFFGEGNDSKANEIYLKKIRPFLPEYARPIWDRKITYFVPKGLKKSFYFRGTSGAFAWLFYKYIQTRPKIRQKLFALLDAQTLEEQKELYDQVETKLINFMVRWLMNRHLTLSMLGIPRAQRQLILEDYPGGVSGFALECLQNVFTRLSIQDNYFWRCYITGSYTKNCCPNYLVEGNYETLRNRVDNIHIHTNTISNFLKENPNAYSHYILLDHQDWLAAHDVPALEEEWRLILENSRPGTKILIRSAALRIDFFPEFVLDRVEFEQELTKKLHKQDRVGTYGSVYLGIVK